MAAEAAAAAPRIAALTATLSSTAEALGFRVLLSSPIMTVFQGTVLTVAAGGDVQKLKQWLQLDPSVDKIWISVSTIELDTIIQCCTIFSFGCVCGGIIAIKA
jgi:hypothetical protein